MTCATMAGNAYKKQNMVSYLMIKLHSNKTNSFFAGNLQITIL